MEPFVGWAVLELFGHRQLAGEVDETDVAGKRMVRVHVPCRAGTEETREADGWPAVRIFGPDAIYSLTPCSEAFARQVAERLQPSSYTMATHQLGGGHDGFDDDDETEIEDDDPNDEDG